MDAFLDTARRTDPRALHAVIDEVNHEPLPLGLDEVTTPVLAVVGEKDSAIARRAVLYLDEISPGTAGYTVPEVGHQWNAEKQQLFSDMVRLWIKSESVDDRLVPVGGTR